MAPQLMACRRDRWRQRAEVVYTCMTTQAGDVVALYYAAFDSHRDGWQDLVTDDVLFDGPVQHAHGKADFVTLTTQFLQAHRETHLLGRVDDGNRVYRKLRREHPQRR